MRNKRLQSQITAGRWTLPAVILICTLFWVLTSLLLPDLTSSLGKEGGSTIWQSTRSLLLPSWADRIVSYLVYAIIGYFLIEINNRFTIIRMRASVQTAIYFLLVTVCRKCTCYMPETLLLLLFWSPFIFYSTAINNHKHQAICFIPFSLSEQEVSFFLSSLSCRCCGYSELTVFNHSIHAVSVQRYWDGCFPIGCYSDTPSSTVRWTCSTDLSTI